MFENIPEIAEKYDGFEHLSEGGQGMIYRARHKFLDEVRVIKTIHSNTEFEDAQQRFMREARIAAKLRHPNIAAVHDFIMGHDKDAYLVMEYIDGTNLWELYRNGQKIPHSQVALLAHQVLDALDYLHKQNFVHRDIALDNVMMTQDARGQVVFKLIDLGIAKSLDSNDYKTSTGVALGKVLYISPEALKYGSGSKEVDTRSDLYSFGVMLYQLLTGELPIQGTDQTSLIAGHLYQPPRDFAETDPQGLLSEPLRDVLLHSIEKEPENRFQTAPELSRSLRYVLPPPESASFDSTMMIEDGEVKAASTAAPGASLPRTAQSAYKPPPRARRDRSAEERPAGPFLFGRKGLMAAVVAIVLVAAVLGGLSASGIFGRQEPAPRGRTVELSPLDYGHYQALVIGIDEYDYLNPLTTAVNDARAVSRVLRERYGFRVEEVINPTRQELLDSIWALESRVTSRDNVLVYYAGHGVVDSNLQYWQPKDAELAKNTNWLLTGSQIADNLDATSAKNLLIVVDSCFAGATGEFQDDERPVEEVLPRQSRLVLASGNVEPVADNSGNGHSVFASAFLAALEDNDALLRAVDLYEELSVVVPEMARKIGGDYEQTPTFAPLPNSGDEGGMFLFVPRVPEASGY